jgi:ABC-type dipeptide/oligopeptide/nickel transport system permease component
MKYRNYVAKRLFLLIPIFFGITFVTFVLTYEISDPIAYYIGADSKEISKQQKDRYREELGLNKPLIDRYFIYLGRILTGDWGITPTESPHLPVLEVIPGKLSASVELMIISLIFSLVIGITIGIITFTKNKYANNNHKKIINFISISIPVFVIGLILQYLLFQLSELEFPFFNIPVRYRFDYENFFYNPITGFLLFDSVFTNNFELFNNGIRHIIAPVLALSFLPTIYISQVTRMVIITSLKPDNFVSNKGISLKNRINKYKVKLKTASNSTISIGKFMPSLLITSIVFVEMIFERPGIGYFAVRSLNNIDIAGFMGCVLIISFFYTFSHTFIDIIYMRNHLIFISRKEENIDIEKEIKVKKLQKKKEKYRKYPKSSIINVNYFGEYFCKGNKNEFLIWYTSLPNIFDFVDAQVTTKIDTFNDNQVIITKIKENARDKSHCSICKNFGNNLVYCPYCINYFHREHIYEWLIIKRTCPHCFKAIKPDQLVENSIYVKSKYRY